MITNTSTGIPVTRELLHNYFHNLVNHFFKILPMREHEEASLETYMHSLQVELLGCKEFLPCLSSDSSYLTLLSILQYLIDHSDADVRIIRREVFKCITICNKLSAQYMEEVSDK